MIIVIIFISISSVKQILFRSKELVIFISKQNILEIDNIIQNQILSKFAEKTDTSLYKAKTYGKNCAYISDSNGEIVRNYI
ncbi:MAG: hypothetical protein ACRC0V_03165 [Fusobacteriaceae bacterium]